MHYSHTLFTVVSSVALSAGTFIAVDTISASSFIQAWLRETLIDICREETE